MTVDLPCNTDVDMDLSTAEFVLDDGAAGDTGPYGQYQDGVIWTIPVSEDPFVGRSPEFFFPGLTTEALPYEVTLTYDPGSTHDRGGREFALASLPAGGEQDAMAANDYTFDLYDGLSNTEDSVTFTINPEAGKNIMFETAVEGAISDIIIHKVCTPVSSAGWGVLGKRTHRIRA